MIRAVYTLTGLEEGPYRFPKTLIDTTIMKFLPIAILTLLVCGSEAIAQTQVEQRPHKQDISNSTPGNFIEKKESVPDPRRTDQDIDVQQNPSNVSTPHGVPTIAPSRPEINTDRELSTDPNAKRQSSTVRQSVPDERVLWRLYNSRRYSAVDAKIRVFKRRYPTWSPPFELVRLMADHRQSAIAKQAEKAKRWGKLIRLAQTYPGYFNCTRVDSVWNLAKAYAINRQPKKAVKEYADVINQCGKDPIKIATVQKASQNLSALWLEGLWSIAEAKISKPSAKRELDFLHYEVDKKHFLEAQSKGSTPTTDSLAKGLEHRVESYHDVSAAKSLGWYYLNRKNYEHSLLWFKKAHLWKPGDEHSTYGLALSLAEVGQLGEAEKLVRTIADQSEKGNKLLGEILLQLAWSRFESQDFSASRRLAAEASSYPDSSLNAEVLLAWLDYREKNYETAVDNFESLYQRNPDSSTARGLALSYTALDNSPLPELTQTHSTGPLGEELKRLYSQDLYWRKHFLAAHDQSPTQSPNLENIDSPWVSANSMFRYKTGDNGLNRLDIFSYTLIEGMYVHNRVHRIALHYDLVNLNSHNPPNCAPIGSLPIQAPCASPDVSLNLLPTAARPTIALNSGNPLVQDPTTRLNTGHSLEFSYYRDGWYTPYFSLGVTPINGVISPRPTFRVGFSQEFSSGRWGPELYSQPVRESILSYTGIKDPYSSTEWGRVLRSGINLPLLAILDDNWSFTGNVDVAALHGEQVKTNWTVSTTASVGYDFRIPNFDYFSLGPSASFQHFDQNQNYFTIGHGGYFSPDYLINVGLGLNFLTSEGRSFVLRGRIGAGYQKFQTADAPWFPLGNPVQSANQVQITLDGRPVFNGSPFYAGNAEAGIAYDLELKGVWLIHPNFQIGGGVSARRTGGFDDYSAGLFFRYILDGRKASFSSDIPDYLFRKLY